MWACRRNSTSIAKPNLIKFPLENITQIFEIRNIGGKAIWGIYLNLEVNGQYDGEWEYTTTILGQVDFDKRFLGIRFKKYYWKVSRFYAKKKKTF